MKSTRDWPDLKPNDWKFSKLPMDYVLACMLEIIRNCMHTRQIMMKTVSPITPDQQSQVVDRTYYYIDLATSLFNKTFEPIPVNFKLTGRAAGMYHVKSRQRYIRYNPYIFSKYFDDNLLHTVPHEVAHYIADQLYGIRNIRPHGKEWQCVMNQFEVPATIHCQYDLEGIPQRRHRRFLYECLCNKHEITSRRHNLIQNHKRLYACPSCKSTIQYLRDK